MNKVCNSHDLPKAKKPLYYTTCSIPFGFTPFAIMQILNFVKKLLVLLCGTKQHREETCSHEILCIQLLK